MKMDAALGEERDQIGPRVRDLMQTILDRYGVGVEVVGINLQQSGVRPPEQVQAAFDDVLKAGQERERAKNEAQAYANDVIPRAVGSASRLTQEADGYKSRIIAQAQGDAQRFKSILTEYQRAPQVTRDRMYLDAMQQIYSSVTKILVDSRQGGQLLYLPLDKILQQVSQGGAAAAAAPPPSPAQPDQSGSVPTSSTSGSGDARSRDSGRSRERETR
jgi:modulator of FtsH protease HflK